MKKTINLLFAGTSDYIPLATVTAISAKMNLSSDYDLKIYYLYADIVKTISDEERQNIFEYASETYSNYGIAHEFIDVSDRVSLFDGQNVGLWGKEISLTHYFYLLSPEILTDVEKVIYIDTDMIVNCDLSEAYNIDLGNKLLAMGAPRGFEEMGDDVCNSGFIVLNLDLWRKENTLSTLLEFGRTIPKCNFCDQNLLYQYFTKNHCDRLMHVDRLYNIFPQLFPDIRIDDIKVLHYTGWNCIKPWYDFCGAQRAGFLWWKYAKMTSFYEQFLFKNVEKHFPEQFTYKNCEMLFSIKNFKDTKILTILGIKIEFKRKNK